MVCSKFSCKMSKKIVITQKKPDKKNQNRHRSSSTFEIALRDPDCSTDSVANLFNNDLYDTTVSINIPLRKLGNNVLRNFLIHHSGIYIPRESTIRKIYVSELYQKTIMNIRDFVKEKHIWLSIGVAKINGYDIANVVIGTLEIDRPGKTFLLTSKILSEVTYQAICELFEDALLLLWPITLRRNQVLLFITEPVPYMIEAAYVLTSLHTKMIHVTCLACGLRSIADELQHQFPKVESLIMHLEKMLLSKSSRVQTEERVIPETTNSRDPSKAIWGPWLDAACFYSENVNYIKNTIKALDNDNDVSYSVDRVKLLIADPILKSNLNFIKYNFGSLSNQILNLEKHGTPLVKSINLFDMASENIFATPGRVGRLLQNKITLMMGNNYGLKLLTNISNILAGIDDQTYRIQHIFTPSEVLLFKYAPVSCMAAYKSFSVLTFLLEENYRRKLAYDNLEMELVIKCNSHFFGKIFVIIPIVKTYLRFCLLNDQLFCCFRLSCHTKRTMFL